MKVKLALLAENIHNSVLPMSYEFLGKGIGYDTEFQIFDIHSSELMATVQHMKDTLDGFTVTMPYKVKILEYCDETDASAEKCGSANTILVKDGKLVAYNTDGWGLIKCLDLKGHSFRGKNVTLVGAGGVGLSIAYSLSVNHAAMVNVLNKFPEETDRLVGKMGPLFVGHELTREALRECVQDADYFINASVLGQVGFDDYDDLSFLKYLKPNGIVFDVNYSNPNAKLPIAAREMGLTVYVGKAMSSCQGIRAMEIWTGKTPSDDAARELVALVENGK